MAAHGRHHADTVLLAALAGGQTIERAAQCASVSERTARRRLDDPAFPWALAAARRALARGAHLRLAADRSPCARPLRAAAGSLLGVRLSCCHRRVSAAGGGRPTPGLA